MDNKKKKGDDDGTCSSSSLYYDGVIRNKFETSFYLAEVE
jgi:hypothetical protein